jgi:hypothetical protein
LLPLPAGTYEIKIRSKRRLDADFDGAANVTVIEGEEVSLEIVAG